MTVTESTSGRGMVKNSLCMLTALLVILLGVAFAYAVSPLPVTLGSAISFSVLAASAITNTGSTVIGSDLGLSPGTAVTGFPPGIVNGVMHVADLVAAQAQTDLTAAYNDAAGRSVGVVTLADGELGGRTLTPGIYKSGISSFMISSGSNLILDAQGDPNAVFIFQMPSSTLTTISGTQVLLVNNANPCNVFWQVGSSATLGTNSVFKGTILALDSITVTTGVNLEGRALARNGAVTLDTNIVALSCQAKLTVTKVVINDNGGIYDVNDFPLFVDLTPVISGVENSFDSGSYIVSELSDLDAEYFAVISGDCALLDGSITLHAGEVKHCTITNNDIYVPPTKGTLQVIKHVINDDSGAKFAPDFTMLVTGANPDKTSFPGKESGILVTLDPGNYTVDETEDLGYDKVLSANCSGTIAAGESRICTITNNDVHSTPPPLPPGGVPEFTPFAIGLAVAGVGLGLVFLRKQH